MARTRLLVAGRAVALATTLATAAPTRSAAQTDYYNTDRGRPIRIEDAYPTERYSLDAHLAPIRLDRLRGGVYRWEIDPEVAYGILPRTQLELGLPVEYTDLGERRHRAGVAGADLSLLYNLNVETTTIPALAVRGSALFPVGPLAPDKMYPSLQAMLTRTFAGARVHANAEYTVGGAPPAGGDASAVDLSRWLAGVAVDRTMPVKSLLVTGELFARQPIRSVDELEWNVGAGLRFQLSPLTALDGGLGKRLTGADRSWFVTFGVARVYALPFYRGSR